MIVFRVGIIFISAALGLGVRVLGFGIYNVGIHIALVWGTFDFNMFSAPWQTTPA